MTAIPDGWIAAAQAAEKKWGIPASVQLAQAIIESGWGAHSPGNNPFGMKCRAGRDDPVQMLMTTEWSKARGYYKEPQPFRLFPTIAAAFDAHAQLLATAPIYADARAKLPDITAFVEALAVHYATDPLYASKVLAVMGGSAHLYAYNVSQEHLA